MALCATSGRPRFLAAAGRPRPEPKFSAAAGRPRFLAASPLRMPPMPACRVGQKGLFIC
jgi:hypothetical protein